MNQSNKRTNENVHLFSVHALVNRINQHTKNVSKQNRFSIIFVIIAKRSTLRLKTNAYTIRANNLLCLLKINFDKNLSAEQT